MRQHNIKCKLRQNSPELFPYFPTFPQRFIRHGLTNRNAQGTPPLLNYRNHFPLSILIERRNSRTPSMWRLSLQRQAVDTLETANDVMNESWAPLLVKGLFLLPTVRSGPRPCRVCDTLQEGVLTWLSLCVTLTAVGGGGGWAGAEGGRGQKPLLRFWSTNTLRPVTSVSSSPPHMAE